MKKKICFIAQFPPPIHGLSKAVETLYNSELSQEFEFEKIDISENKRILKNLAEIRKSKADLFYFTISQTMGGNLRDLLILKAIGNRHCLIHLHGGFYRTLVEGFPKWQKKANYRAVGKLQGAIVLGPSLKWIFEGMLPDERIFTVPNCVDDEYLMNDEEFEEKITMLPARKVKHVLYLSNFIKSKGYPLVLEMAKQEKQRVEKGEEKKFHFDFAGKFYSKAEENQFWDYVRDNALEEYITYHGIVGGERKKELLKLCDIFCLLTTYPKEGQPISILEAMGNGMVIVTTDYAGIPDIVQPNFSIVLNPNNPKLARSAFDALAEIDYARMERKARQKVKMNYTQRRYLDNMRNIYKKT